MDDRETLNAWAIAQIRVRPIDTEFTGRKVHCHDLRGEWRWSIEEATEFLIQLTAALERALDPTPLPPEPGPSRKVERSPRSPRESSLEDLI